jgi:hypothetical protein
MKQPSREATSGEPTGVRAGFSSIGAGSVWVGTSAAVRLGCPFFFSFFLLFSPSPWMLKSLNQGWGVGARSLKVYHSR